MARVTTRARYIVFYNYNSFKLFLVAMWRIVFLCMFYYSIVLFIFLSFSYIFIVLIILKSSMCTLCTTNVLNTMCIGIDV